MDAIAKTRASAVDPLLVPTRVPHASPSVPGQAYEQALERLDAGRLSRADHELLKVGVRAVASPREMLMRHVVLLGEERLAKAQPQPRKGPLAWFAKRHEVLEIEAPGLLAAAMAAHWDDAPRSVEWFETLQTRWRDRAPSVRDGLAEAATLSSHDQRMLALAFFARRATTSGDVESVSRLASRCLRFNDPNVLDVATAMAKNPVFPVDAVLTVVTHASPVAARSKVHARVVDLILEGAPDEARRAALFAHGVHPHDHSAEGVAILDKLVAAGMPLNRALEVIFQRRPDWSPSELAFVLRQAHHVTDDSLSPFLAIVSFEHTRTPAFMEGLGKSRLSLASLQRVVEKLVYLDFKSQTRAALARGLVARLDLQPLAEQDVLELARVVRELDPTQYGTYVARVLELERGQENR